MAGIQSRSDLLELFPDNSAQEITAADSRSLILSVPVFTGAWSSGVSYNINDEVTFGGIRYICIVANISHSPPNADYWSPAVDFTQVTEIRGGINMNGTALNMNNGAGSGGDAIFMDGGSVVFPDIWGNYESPAWIATGSFGEPGGISLFCYSEFEMNWQNGLLTLNGSEYDYGINFNSPNGILALNGGAIGLEGGDLFGNQPYADGGGGSVYMQGGDFAMYDGSGGGGSVFYADGASFEAVTVIGFLSGEHPNLAFETGAFIADDGEGGLSFYTSATVGVTAAGNLAMTDGSAILLNGGSDTNWRIGLNLGSSAFTTWTIGNSTAVQHVIGGGTDGPDGWAVGLSGGGSIIECRGHDGQVFMPGDAVIGSALNSAYSGFAVDGMGQVSVAPAAWPAIVNVLGVTGTLTILGLDVTQNLTITGNGASPDPSGSFPPGEVINGYPSWLGAAASGDTIQIYFDAVASNWLIVDNNSSSVWTASGSGAAPTLLIGSYSATDNASGSPLTSATVSSPDPTGTYEQNSTSLGLPVWSGTANNGDTVTIYWSGETWTIQDNTAAAYWNSAGGTLAGLIGSFTPGYGSTQPVCLFGNRSSPDPTGTYGINGINQGYPAWGGTAVGGDAVGLQWNGSAWSLVDSTGGGYWSSGGLNNQLASYSVESGATFAVQVLGTPDASGLVPLTVTAPVNCANVIQINSNLGDDLAWMDQNGDLWLAGSAAAQSYELSVGGNISGDNDWGIVITDGWNQARLTVNSDWYGVFTGGGNVLDDGQGYMEVVGGLAVTGGGMTVAGGLAVTGGGLSVSGGLAVGNGFSVNILTVTAPYTMTGAEATVLIDSAVSVQVNLLQAQNCPGQIFTFKSIQSAAVIAGQAGQTIDGAGSYNLTGRLKYVTVQSDGSNYWVIGNN